MKRDEVKSKINDRPKYCAYFDRCGDFDRSYFSGNGNLAFRFPWKKYHIDDGFAGDCNKQSWSVSFAEYDLKVRAFHHSASFIVVCCDKCNHNQKWSSLAIWILHLVIM